MWSMSSSVRPSGPFRISASSTAVSRRRNGSGGAARAGGGGAAEGAVGERLVLEREPERALEVRVDVAHLERAVAVRRAQLVVLDRRDVEVLAQRAGERLLRLGGRLADQPVRREDGEARILERDEAHQHVAVLALAADLVGVDARGLVAVVAVGDEQLG